MGRAKIALQTMHGTYLKVTNGESDEGPLISTATDWQGWETFIKIPYDGQTVALKTFHQNYLSVADDGKLTTAENCGENERFELQLVEDDKYSLKTSRGTFISVGTDEAVPVGCANGITGASELFRI